MSRIAAMFGTGSMIPATIRTIVVESKGDPEILTAVVRAASMLLRTGSKADPMTSSPNRLPDRVQSIEAVSMFGRTLTALLDVGNDDVTKWVIEECGRTARLENVADQYEMAVAAGTSMGADLMRAAAVRSAIGVTLLPPQPGPRHDMRYHAYRLLDAVIDPRINTFIETLMKAMATGTAGPGHIIRKTAEIGMITEPSDLDDVNAALRRIRCCIDAWIRSRGAVYDFTGRERAVLDWTVPMPSSCMTLSGCRYIHLGEATPTGWEGAFLLGRDIRLDGFPSDGSDATGTLLMIPSMPIHEDDHVGSTLRAIIATIPVHLHDHDDVERATERALQQSGSDGIPGRSVRNLPDMIATTLRAMSQISEG